MKFAAVVLFAALASSAQATFAITDPTSEIWWVAGGPNLLNWTCYEATPYETYTVYLFGGSIPPGGLPLAANVQNFDCSEYIPTNGNIGPGNYTVALVPPEDVTDLFAVSEPFEVKGQGAPYYTPTVTATPTSTVSATNSHSASTTASVTTTSTSTKGGSKTGGAAGPIGVSSAIISGIAFAVGAFFA